MQPDRQDFRVTVFGGTGYLGRCLVGLLLRRGFRVRIAVRHPRPELFANAGASLEQVEADVRQAPSVAAAIDAANGVVNAVGLYQESPEISFETIHVDGAARVAELAQAAGARLVHVSGIGVDPDSPSAYIRARALGEERVRTAAADAVIVRPSALFGPDDAFVRGLSGLLRALPVVPLFGDGSTRLQPVHVEDVASAVAAVFESDSGIADLYELGGPGVYRYRDLLRLIANTMGRKRWLLPVPFAAWRVIAGLVSMLPNAPITADQVELMRRHNTADPELPGFGELGIKPRPLEEFLSRYLSAPKQ